MEKKNKVLVLGVDGMDPRITKKFLEMGVMPNLKKSLIAALSVRIWCS